jgi:multiple sugar transport system permease protein
MIVVYVILGAGLVLMVLPLLWMITTSLSSNIYATTFPPKFFPTEFDWGNYLKIFSQHDLAGWVLNSVAITIPAMVGQVIISSMGAYAFARLRAPGKNVLFIIVLTTLMIPGEVTLIPTFVLFKYLGMLNTLWPLIIPNFFGNAYNIFLMRQFFMSIPLELDDAAKIDGLSLFGIWWRLILPAARPVLAAVAIFTFTANWGNFLGPLIYITNPHRYPLALGVYTLTQTSNVAQPPHWNLVMAGSMLLTLPMTLVFFFGQRQIYEGANFLGRQA